MTGDRPTPLDRMRRYVSSLQEADRPSESYVTVALGDLAAIVTLADVLRADHADPALGWSTAAIEAAEYERIRKILDEVVKVVTAHGTQFLRDAVDAVLVSVPSQTPDDPDDEEHDEEPEEELGEHAENMALREDLEDLQNQREDLEEKIKELERALTKERELIASLRVNGARHWFAFGYDKPSVQGSPYVQYCSVCNRDKDHPAHLQSTARYLDSRDMERDARTVQARLERLLHGAGTSPETAAVTALEILRGLPGIPASGQEEGER